MLNPDSLPFGSDPRPEYHQCQFQAHFHATLSLFEYTAACTEVLSQSSPFSVYWSKKQQAQKFSSLEQNHNLFELFNVKIDLREPLIISFTVTYFIVNHNRQN